MDAVLEARISKRLATMDRNHVLERIWAGDHTVWKPDPTEISNRLGWLTAVDLMRDRLFDLKGFASRAEADGFETALLLGMGGSSLAAEVLAATFGAADDSLELIVLDTTHPATIERLTHDLDLQTTLFVVASKSGTTTETLSHLAHFWSVDPDGEHFVAITDPGTPLEALATERGFRAVFTNPEDIGGRYSALSYFGLVPAALIGGPLHELLDGATSLRMAYPPTGPAAENPSATLGVAIGEGARAGRDKLTLLLPQDIGSLGNWIEQLVAESTGKEGVGVVPIVDEPVGDPDAYGEDRLFVAVGDHEELAAVEGLGHPVARLSDGGPGQLGQEFLMWEIATVVVGYVLGINPFDQPNVQESKDATSRILAEGQVEDPGFDDFDAILKGVRPGDYVAITAFLDRTSETEDALQRARIAIRDRLRVATTVGFGPRFLHSTGQLHKGGANNGVFVQVVDEARETDLPIPGQDFTFGTLIDAQALGDLRSLRARGRRAARVTLDSLLEVT